ncbi:MAG: hypothetical protein IJX80_03160 [Clostridia bacterium]|nr:hypothetical protein [Clostridia bacterium]
MNAYYNKNRYYNSNNDIFESYFYGRTKTAPSWKRLADRLLSYLCIILSVLTGAMAKRLYKAASVALCLVGIAGLIGAMESGTLPLWSGILISIPLLAVEFFTLRKH